jgi:hypothetical protein
MLIKIREAALAGLLIAATMGASALQAQTAAPQKDEEEVRWVLPPPPHLSAAPTQPQAPAPEIAATPAEAPNPFGGAPVTRPAAQLAAEAPQGSMQSVIPASAPLEAPSLLAPSVTFPMALQPPAAAPAPVAATPEPTPAPAPRQAEKKPAVKKPAAQAKADVKAKTEAKAKPAEPKAKPVRSTETGTAEAKPADAKPAPKRAAVAAKPVVRTRPPEPVPPPPSMTEKEPEDSGIPVLSKVMGGVTSVGKKIGGLFD